MHWRVHSQGIPPEVGAAAVLGAGQAPVTALPGVAGPVTQTEGRVMPWRALWSVEAVPAPGLGCRNHRGGAPAAAAPTQEQAK